jgi:acetoin utilization deacetylase AcuC-like enzyme
MAGHSTGGGRQARRQQWRQPPFHVERAAVDAARPCPYRAPGTTHARSPLAEAAMSDVWLFADSRMIEHRPPAGHPERPERLAAILQRLKRNDMLFSCPAGTVRPATDAELGRVHGPQYLAAMRRVSEAGGGPVEADTWMSPRSEEAARLAAGAAVEAVAAVVEGRARRAFCAIRPPGHHARPGAAMGFCLFGNVAVAAADALERHGLARVLIADFDVHHGNGTQEMFEADGRVGFLSIHRYPFYPGTGAADETGRGPGLGLIRNEPVAFGTPRESIRDRFRSALEALAAKVRPELVLVSAGFDAHAQDPIGSLGLEVEDFVTFTRDLIDVADAHAGGRIVSLLEGGYNVPVLAECVAAHLAALGAEGTV